MAAKNKPSTPKAARMPIDDTVADQQIEELFASRPPTGQAPIYDQFDNFIRSTAQSKVAVIVPLFGYWSDVHDGFLDEEVLRAAVNRITSSNHTHYAVIVAETERMSHPVYETLNGRYVGGNVRGVRVDVGSPYSTYVSEGIRIALEETDAQYLIVYNPWGVIQAHGIDTMVDRVNLNGNAPVICGYDMHAEIAPDEFDRHKAVAPREFASYKAKHLLSFNFLGMRRFIAEMVKVDPTFKTQPFAERDFFQQIAMKGFDAVTSERVPTFFFDVPWEQYVPHEWYDEDLVAFRRKWGFTPGDIKIR